MSDDPKTFDAWLSDDGPAVPPAALVIREHLMPVEGGDAVFFPPTFAAAQERDGFPGGYNLDPSGDGTSICLIDTVGSQANRIEPEFAKDKCSALVPQVVVKAGEQRINLLDAGHRAGDALVRCSALQGELQAAFKAVLKGDARPLAKVAPTSFVFGVWDSRDTQAKLPRLVTSTIRAFGVCPQTRTAQYVPAADYIDAGLLPEPESSAAREAYAQRGFVHQPVTKPESRRGGVIAASGIRRDATLSLAALRLLAAGKNQADTMALRRYELVEVYPDGRRVTANVTHDAAVEYAHAAAKAFGVGQDRTVEFDKERAKRDVRGDPAKAKKAKTKKAGK
jgi:CRISPR-associated protein Csb1